MGYNVGVSGSTPLVSTSDATGSVSGTGNYVGGLVGYSTTGPRSAAATPRAKSAVPVTSGGLAGYNTDAINISYAKGDVTGTKNVGGLVGDNVGSIANTLRYGQRERF